MSHHYVETRIRRSPIIFGAARTQFAIFRSVIASLAMLLLFTRMAFAFDPYSEPPLAYNIDNNGMDLVSGGPQLTFATVSIGQPGQGGLRYDFQYIGDGPQHPSSPYANWGGSLVDQGGGLAVQINGAPSGFLLVGGVYQSLDGNGETITFDGTNYHYTGHDGGTAVFTPISGSPDVYMMTTQTRASGEVLTYTYNSTIIQSVNNSLGYQLKFNYACLSVGEHCGSEITEIIAINNAIDYCDPAANSCTGMTRSWPTIRPSYGTFGPVPDAVVAVTDPAGITTEFSSPLVPSSLFKQIITRPSGRYFSTDWYEYDEENNTLKFWISDGVSNWNYVYDWSEYPIIHTTITDPLGHVRKVDSNDNGQIKTDTVDPGGANLTTTYEYDTFHRIAKITYPAGNYDQFTYDSRGNRTRLDRVAVPGSGTPTITTLASYPSTCAAGDEKICNQPTDTTDPNGNVTTYTYDAASGGVLTVTSPAVAGGSPVTQNTYQAKYAWYHQDATSTIYQAPAPVYKLTQTVACYGCSSSAQRVTTSSFVSGSSSVATNLLPASTTVADGASTISSTVSMTYDDIGNVATTTGPLSGQTSATFYNADRQVIGTVAPDPDGSGALLNPATKITYDGDGLAILAEQGTAPSESYSDWADHFTSLAQKSTAYTTTYFPLQAQSNSYIGGTGNTPVLVTQSSYDGARNPLCTAVRENPAVYGSLPDACTQTTAGAFGPDQISYTSYDTANRVTSVQSGYGTGSPITVVTNGYGSGGELAYVEDADGNRSQYVYDGLFRQTALQYPSKTTPHTPNASDYNGFSYDLNGNVTAKRLRDGTTIYTTFDALNRPTKQTDPVSSAKDVYYNYDFLNDLLYAHYGSSGGVGIDYTYDALGRKLTETSYGRTVTSAYDAAGNRTGLTYPDSVTMTYTYDLLNRETQIWQGSTGMVAYGYDDLGRRTYIGRANSTSTGISYNGSNANWSMAQNLSGSSQDASFDYSAGPAGQMAQRAINNASYQYSNSASVTTNSCANGLNQYAVVGGSSGSCSGGTSFAYDDRGNLTSDGHQTYSYDAQNRLVQVLSGGSAGTPTNWGAANWNAFQWSGTPAMTLAYDPAGRLQQTVTLSSTEQYLYDGTTLIAEYNGSGTMLRRYVPGPGVDETAVWYEGSNLSAPHWLITDERGSVIGASDASGVATLYTYSVTGEPGGGWGSSPPAPIFRYTGQAALSQIGLYYYKARMYDPALGRFLQTDPAGYDAGMNIYAYVGNNPANATDPSGMDGCGYSRGVDMVVVTPCPTPTPRPQLDTDPDAAAILAQVSGDARSRTYPNTAIPQAAPPAKPLRGTNPNPPKSRLACFGSALWENKTGLALDAAGWVANFALPEGSAGVAIAGTVIGTAGIAGAIADHTGPVDMAVAGTFAYAGKQGAIAEGLLRGAGSALGHRIGFGALTLSSAYDAAKTAASYNACLVEK